VKTRTTCWAWVSSSCSSTDADRYSRIRDALLDCALRTSEGVAP